MTSDLENKISMGELIEKAGLDDLHKLNKPALLGLLLDGKKKLDSQDKRIKKDTMQYYTNLGVKKLKVTHRNNTQL